MKTLIGILLLCTLGSTTARSQTVLTLDSCRTMALRNNKELRIAREKTKAARYERKAAFTNYLPKLSATGAYLHNNKEISLLSDEQQTAISNMGTSLATALPPLQSLGVDQLLNSLGGALVNDLRTDTRNVYAGAVTLTQPIFMGGKIIHYNQIAQYAKQLAESMHDLQLQEIIYKTDETYWQVISLVNKKQLADAYVDLLRKTEQDITAMVAEGIATEAEGLSVKVKLNEAEMAQTKVNNGLALSRMLLAQLCGLSLDEPLTLADEKIQDFPSEPVITAADVNEAFLNRNELKSLDLATRASKSRRPPRAALSRPGKPGI